MEIFLIIIGVCLVAGIGFMLFLMASFYFSSPAGKPIDKDKPFGYFWGKFNKNKIYYASGAELGGVDTETFELVDYNYAKDKNCVYFKQYSIDVALATFYVDGNVPKDAGHVYYIDLNQEEEAIAFTIDGADPLSYQEIDGRSYWAKDHAHYFMKGKIIEVIDYDSFLFISDDWAKDKNNLYQLTEGGFNIVDADVSDITLLASAVVCDGKKVYVSAYMQGDGDQGTLQLNVFDYQFGSEIELLSDVHIRHNGKIYSYGLPTEIDADSFHPFLDANQQLLMGFSKDKNCVYLFNIKLPHIDVATFTYDSYDFRDKDNHYDRNGQVITPLNNGF